MVLRNCHNFVHFLVNFIFISWQIKSYRGIYGRSGRCTDHFNLSGIWIVGGAQRIASPRCMHTLNPALATRPFEPPRLHGRRGSLLYPVISWAYTTTTSQVAILVRIMNLSYCNWRCLIGVWEEQIITYSYCLMCVLYMILHLGMGEIP
jgi:hypothetical protein